MTRQWTAQDVLEIARGFQATCVLTAGAPTETGTQRRGAGPASLAALSGHSGA